MFILSLSRSSPTSLKPEACLSPGSGDSFSPAAVLFRLFVPSPSSLACECPPLSPRKSLFFPPPQGRRAPISRYHGPKNLYRQDFWLRRPRPLFSEGPGVISSFFFFFMDAGVKSVHCPLLPASFRFFFPFHACGRIYLLSSSSTLEPFPPSKPYRTPSPPPSLLDAEERLRVNSSRSALFEFLRSR